MQVKVKYDYQRAMRAILQKYLVFALLGLAIFNAYAQDKWTKETDYPGSSVKGVYAPNADVVNNEAFIAFGVVQSTSSVLPSKNLYSYNPLTQTWTPKASFPGSGRYGVVSFAINDTIYYATGSDNQLYLNEVWAYSVKDNIWKQKSTFPGSRRIHGTGFVVNNKGYVFGGSDGSSELSDLWEFDPSTGNWTQKASLNLYGRVGASSFVINNIAYIVGGKTLGNSYFDDTWAYNPSTNEWVKKASRVGININVTQNATQSGVGFAIDSIGYYSQGVNLYNYSQGTFKYNPISDSWETTTSFSGTGRFMSIAFVVNNKAYSGLGASYWSPPQYEKDIWKFTPDAPITSSVEENDLSRYNSFKVFPNPSTSLINVETLFDVINGSIVITSIKGIDLIKQTGLSGRSFKVACNELEAGEYIISIINGSNFHRAKFIKE